VQLACTQYLNLTGGRQTADECCRIKDINESCLAQFRTHWQCLENHNQQLWNCRSEERRLNGCVFEKLVRPNTQICYGCCANVSRT